MSYVCEWENACIVDRLTRTQCQRCRFDKCLAVGMTPCTVLNERQRIVKRQIREEKRNHRQNDVDDNILPLLPQVESSGIVGSDESIIQTIVQSYRRTFTRNGFSKKRLSAEEVIGSSGSSALSSLHLADLLTPSVSKIIEFAKCIPGFTSLTATDQVCLLQGSCLEILCLRAALRYDSQQQAFPLRDQGLLTRSQMICYAELRLLLPLFNYALRIQELDLDDVEAALLAAVLSLQSSRPGLSEPERVELYQDAIMKVSLRYSQAKKPDDAVHWLKTLLRTPPLRGLSVRQAEKAIYISIDNIGSLPLICLHLFEEDV